MQAAASPAIAVVVAHAEPLITSGLVAALQGHPGIEVERGAVERGLELAYAADVLVTDHASALTLRAVMAQTDGAWIFHPAKLLVVTDLDREQDIRQALDKDVEGYLLQGCALSELVHCVRTLAQGGHYLALSVAKCMAESRTRQALTGRETEVLQLLAVGRCNKTIARNLDISSSTVKSHVQAILRKLAATSRTEAISLADRRGLLGNRAARRHTQDIPHDGHRSGAPGATAG